MKNIIFQGPIRNHVGIKPLIWKWFTQLALDNSNKNISFQKLPLYSAENPSFRTVWMPQSMLPLYSFWTDCDWLAIDVLFEFVAFIFVRFLWFISRVCRQLKNKRVFNIFIYSLMQWLTRLTLITSMGVEATALPKLAIKLDLELKKNKYVSNPHEQSCHKSKNQVLT